MDDADDITGLGIRLKTGDSRDKTTSRVGEPMTPHKERDWLSPRRTGRADFPHPALVVPFTADIRRESSCFVFWLSFCLR